MGGGSKGGGGHTPYEAPDSLKSAQKLCAIGLISLGPIKGTVNKWKTTYFDNTPIQNANGKDDNDTDSFNFKNTEIQFTLGTQDQLPLKGFEASEREVPVNAEVKHAHPLTKTVIDPDVSRLRLTLAVSALFSQNDQGDTHGTSVTFEVLINNLPRNTYTIEGKSSSRFFRSYIIENLPEVPFTVTVKRVTEDSKSQRLQNATSWASYTEIIDTKLSYPNMALVGIKTDSRYNPNFPNINFLLHGRLVKIPSNYDPVARTYAAGIWKGDFKEDWTNNPAWVFYDLVTNKQVGLGERLGDFGVDKFQLYQIAQYCDQLVPDGYGGQEPRMTANLWITEQRSAYEVLSDMASVFRAMVIWNGQQMTATQDRPTDPVCTYTQSNVIDGKFTRQYVAQKAIYTAVEVEYADKRNMYQKAIEYVADDDLIRRYGYNVKKITAFACTSRGQAHRYGKWILETSRLEQCTITFSVGREGMAHLPGDIIEVADNRYANTNLGGRVLSINGKMVTLDRPIDFAAGSYLGYLSAEGTAEIVRVKILSVDDKQRINLEREPVGLVENANWTLHTAQVKTQLYRAIGIAENEDGSFAITALQHEPQKEVIVDNGANFEPRSTTTYTVGPKSISHLGMSMTEGGITFTWEQPTSLDVVTYDIKLYKDGKLYHTYFDLKTTSITFENLPNGSYVAEIRAKNQFGQYSDAVKKTFEVNLTIKNLRTKSMLFAIEVLWDLPELATVGNYTELWHATENNIQRATKLATLSYPMTSYVLGNVGLSEKHYFWARMSDKSGNKGEFTEAVFGEADHNQDNLLNAIEGKITKSHLGQELINSLKNDVNSAVSAETQKRHAALIAEANSRVKAIQDESIKISKKIEAETLKAAQGLQAEINARGTAIQKLEQVDNQQAKTIEQVTAKADQALAGLQQEQTARADGDKAEAQARNALASRVAAAESGITDVRQSIATANNSIAEVSQNLNAKIDSLSVGGRNLLRNSRSEYTGNRYATIYALASIPNVGEMVTVTLWGQLAEDRQTFAVYNTHGYRELAKLNKIREGVYSATFAWNQPLNNREEKDNSLSTHLNVYAYPRVATSDNTITQVKLERGTIATDWTPAPEDTDSTISAVSADLTSYKQAQATKEQATAQQISGLTTRMANAESGISRVEKAVSDNQSSTVTQLNQLSANLTKAQTDLNAKITQEQTARADGDKALSTRLDTLNATVGKNTASISAIQSAKADKTEVASLARTTLQSEWQADSTAKANKAKSDAVSEAQKLKTAISAKIDSIQQTLSNADKALGSRIDTVTASINDTKAQVSQVSSAVAGVDGKLSSTHTIKTQVVGGGRVAIAGIALGASSDGKTAESSVIVMADKFGIVANANDSNVKQVFSVANGQVGIRGDLVVAGSVTRDKLSSGGGGNLLDNPIFANNAYGWGENRGNGALTGQTTSLVRRMSNKFSGLVTNSSVMIAEVRANSAVSSWWQIATQTVSVDPGRRYCFSAYMDAWACTGELMIQEIAGDGKSWVRDFAFSGRKGRSVAGYSQSGALEDGDGSIQSSTRSHVFFTAPSTGYISVVCIMRDIQKASVLKVAMPMLEECTEHATEPSPWQNAGLTEVHGGSIIANTIRGDHIQANQEIRAPRISGGEIDISGNDGILRVGRTGNFLVRASSQNRGLVMNNDQIIVYDERGNVRVKIGRL